MQILSIHDINANVVYIQCIIILRYCEFIYSEQAIFFVINYLVKYATSRSTDFPFPRTFAFHRLPNLSSFALWRVKMGEACET